MSCSMDISPAPAGFGSRVCDSASTASTPGEQQLRDKRMRDDDITLYMEPPSKQPMVMATPTASPAARSPLLRGTDERHALPASACHTPLAAMPSESAQQAWEMGIRWASHQRLGSRQ